MPVAADLNRLLYHRIDVRALLVETSRAVVLLETSARLHRLPHFNPSLHQLVEALFVLHYPLLHSGEKIQNIYF